MIRFFVGVFAMVLVVSPRTVVAADRANIPLKNWGGFSLYRDSIYDDLERLVTAGLADRVLLSTKPLGRTEAAKIVARAIEKIKGDDAGFYNARRDLEPILERLTEEFRPELVAVGAKLPGPTVPAAGFVTFVPVDRAQVGGGYANHSLRVIDGQGLKFKEGFNGGQTFESRAQIGDFLTFYLQPWLHENGDFVAARLATGYVKLTLYNVELLVGRDSLWWGPGLHGSLILSNNAPPLDQVRIGTAEAFRLPLIGEWVGPIKVLGFLAQLEERRDHKRAKLAGLRGTIAPFSFLELGISRVVQFDGEDRPRLAVRDYPEAVFNPSVGDTVERFRSNNVMAVDGDLRLRNVDRYFMPSRDLRIYGEYGWDDTCCRSNFIPNENASSGLVGAHFLGLFGLENTDLRLEHARTSRLSFNHSQFLSGYWTRGSVISHFIGTKGEDYYARLTTRLTPRLMLGVELDRAIIGTVAGGFGPDNADAPKERRIGGGIDLSYRFWDRYSLFAQYQIIGVRNRDFRSGEDGLDHLLRLEVTRSFR